MRGLKIKDKNDSSMKTFCQWKKLGFKPKGEDSGTLMYTNGTKKTALMYYREDEVELIPQEEKEVCANLKKAHAKHDRLIKRRMEIERKIAESYIDLKEKRYEYYKFYNELKRAKVKQYRKIIFDTETTGLDFDKDEILQLSIIDENGKKLLNEYFCPESHKENSWKEAEAVNGISWRKVKNKKNFHFYKEKIQEIFNSATELIAYNAYFDIGMLKNEGIYIPDVPIYDVMLEFAPIYGEWNDYYGDYKWQKLTTCASYYGYTFNAHDSLEDVKATLHCYNCMNK